MPKPVTTTSGRSKEPESSNPPSLWLGWLLFGAIVAVFAGVRLACLFNDLWLDEIWSLNLVSLIDSPTQILSKLYLDNNHPLNTLFLYWLYPAKAEWTYRLFSWLTGSATVGLAGLIALRQFKLLHPEEPLRRAQTVGCLTAVVFGSSYLLIHYSSEARGYAPAICFSMLAFYALLRLEGQRWSAWIAVYWLACILGLLAHIAAIQLMIAAFVWSAARTMQSSDHWRERLMRTAICHFIPWLFFVFYYVGFVRKMDTGGGPEIALLHILGDLASYTLGFPVGSGQAIALPASILLIAVALGLIWRSQCRLLVVFYISILFLAPALGLSLGSSRFHYLFPRYFIISAAFALLLTGYLLARLSNSGRTKSIFSLVALTLFLGGNAAHTRQLLHHGRGQYLQALRYMAAHTPGATITVSSDHDFRNLFVVTYYANALHGDRRIRYFTAEQLPPEGTQWLLLHRLDGEEAPPDSTTDPNHHQYRLMERFQHSALSGWDWYVFLRSDHDPKSNKRQGPAPDDATTAESKPPTIPQL